MTVEEAGHAVQIAAKAMHRSGQLSARERMKVLESTSGFVLREKRRLVRLLIAETGMTRTQAGVEVERAAGIIRLYSSEIPHLGGMSVPLDADLRGARRHGYWFRVPAGVVLSISAFNNPLVLQAHKLGPALAAGNAVVFKPASVAPLAAIEVCKMFLEAGLPQQFLNVCTGSGSDIGPALAGNPEVRVVAFTGSYETGQSIARAAGVKKLAMELGSNCPNIVCSDCDLEVAVRRIVDAAYSFQGQNCLHAQRILVQHDVYGDFKNQFVEMASKLKMGNPRSPTTDIGPMISEAAASRVEKWVKEAESSGAKTLLGGRRSGSFFEPTLMAGVPPDAKVACQEVYGPVSVISEFSKLKEAIERANTTTYGLQAAIFTSNVESSLAATLNLSFGSIMINESTDFRADIMPFGGFRASGLGREGIGHAIEAMTEIKNIVYTLESPS
jgi:acyl-CoA reductase-like NAD-dependent aldehyde dehydrogenase